MKRQSRLDFLGFFFSSLFSLGVLSIPVGVSGKESERRRVCGAKSEHLVFPLVSSHTHTEYEILEY